MRIDWSGARVLATLIVCIAVAVWAVAANYHAEDMMFFGALGSAIFGGFTWWVFPRIVKQA
jgi:hypothetical protein